MTVVVEPDGVLLANIREISRGVAAQHADDVDRRGRFPKETFDALREAHALSAPVPTDLGGSGVSIPAIAAACLELGHSCGASAMVFAMHHIQLLSLIRHATASSWFAAYVTQISEEERLIASVTSEIGTGGDMGRSLAAATPDNGRISFEKHAPTVSYGQHADDLLISLRRGPTAEPGDQVAVLSRGPQHSLELTGTWDVLGMRGTCSPGFVVRGSVGSEQIVPAEFAAVATESMVPISHILWSHLWLGIAEDAFDRARRFVRAAARRTPGEIPASAQRLSRVSSELSMLRAEVDAGLRDFVAWGDGAERGQLTTLSAALRFNNLKVSTSEHAADVCRGALEVIGIMGFKNDTPFSVGRHLRDTMSAALMIANERIHNTNAGLLVIAKEA